jgi:putative endonuclease
VFVYILANVSRTLYVGVTNDVVRRMEEHRAAGPDTFVGRYHVTRLVHVEVARTPLEALSREKQVKGWSRAKKVALIERSNPGWRDLTDDARADRSRR